MSVFAQLLIEVSASVPDRGTATSKDRFWLSASRASWKNGVPALRSPRRAL
jgi:hypothetical protein